MLVEVFYLRAGVLLIACMSTERVSYAKNSLGLINNLAISFIPD